MWPITACNLNISASRNHCPYASRSALGSRFWNSRPGGSPSQGSLVLRVRCRRHRRRRERRLDDGVRYAVLKWKSSLRPRYRVRNRSYVQVYDITSGQRYWNRIPVSWYDKKRKKKSPTSYVTNRFENKEPSGWIPDTGRCGAVNDFTQISIALTLKIRKTAGGWQLGFSSPAARRIVIKTT